MSRHPLARDQEELVVYHILPDLTPLGIRSRSGQWCTSSSCVMDGRRPTSCTWSFRAFYRYVILVLCPGHGIVNNVQDCNDRNPLVRALAIRTMSYIPTPIVIEALTEQLRHCLKDRDPYVRKTAAICVAKLYTADPRKAEKGGFVEMLRDLLLDSNATVVANAVAALTEIGDRQDGVIFKLNLTVANKLLTALGESSEYVRHSLGCGMQLTSSQVGNHL